MLKSLRAKTTLLVLALGFPFLIASLQGLLYAADQNSLQERKAVAKRAFNRLAKDLHGPNPRSRIAELYDQSGLDALGAGAALVDRTGNVLWESGRRSPGRDPKGALQHVLDEGVLLVAMPEKQPSGDLGLLAVSISGVGLIVYGAGAWLLVGATLRPISKLVSRVNEARAEQNATITPPSTDQEVVSLVETLNTLIGDVKAESRERIDSYATLSHELRTPIHSLLLKLDLALSQERGKEELESTLLDVQSQVFRLKKLSDAVLTLQGLSQNSALSPSEPVDLRFVIEDTLVGIQPLMELKSVGVQLEASQGVEVLANREHLVLLVRNLLENAVRHCPEGSVVTVSVTQSESGPGLGIQNALHKGARSAGNGLGLRICREVARANGWELTTCEEPEGYSATVRF